MESGTYPEDSPDHYKQFTSKEWVAIALKTAEGIDKSYADDPWNEGDGHALLFQLKCAKKCLDEDGVH